MLLLDKLLHKKVNKICMIINIDPEWFMVWLEPIYLLSVVLGSEGKTESYLTQRNTIAA